MSGKTNKIGLCIHLYKQSGAMTHLIKKNLKYFNYIFKKATALFVNFTSVIKLDTPNIILEVVSNSLMFQPLP